MLNKFVRQLTITSSVPNGRWRLSCRKPESSSADTKRPTGSGIAPRSTHGAESGTRSSFRRTGFLCLDEGAWWLYNAGGMHDKGLCDRCTALMRTRGSVGGRVRSPRKSEASRRNLGTARGVAAERRRDALRGSLERAEVLVLRRLYLDGDRRAGVLLALLSGRMAKEVARDFGVTVATARRWLRIWRREGRLSVAKGRWR